MVAPELKEGHSRTAGTARSLATRRSPIGGRKHKNQQSGKPVRTERGNSVVGDHELLSGQQSSHSVEDTDLARQSVDSPSRIVERPDQAGTRLEKMCGAVRTLLECVGEDPYREGLLATPERYAKALLFFTQGYDLKVDDIVNNALFHEGCKEMVIVKDIEIHSLCEHHLVPFTGKV